MGCIVVRFNLDFYGTYYYTYVMYKNKMRK